MPTLGSFSNWRSSRPGRGFTLIELLIVVAIIGVIAAILIPNLLDSLQKAKQKRTVTDVRQVGGAWFSWLTDQAGAAAAGAQTFNFNFGDVLLADDLQSVLYQSPTFFYIQSVPRYDGWGGTYQYRLNQSDLGDYPTLGIRSLARDLAASGATYTVGPFISTNYDGDIVWADGFFISYPAGAQVSGGS